MAVLYRCPGCGALVGALIGTVCRACRTGDRGGSPRPIYNVQEIQVIEPDPSDPSAPGSAVVVNPQASKPEFFMENPASNVDRLNQLTQQIFENNPDLGTYANDLFITLSPGQEWQYTNVSEAKGISLKNCTEKVIRGYLRPGNKVLFDGPLTAVNPSGAYMQVIDMLDLSELGFLNIRTSPRSVSEPEEVPVSPPPAESHFEAILNPKRKLRISE